MGKDENTVSITRGFLSVLSGDIGALLIGFLVTPLLVRLLGSKQYGTYVFLLSLLSILLVISTVGVSDGIRKFIAEDRSEEWRVHVFGFYTRVALGIGVVVAGTIIVAIWIGVVARVFGQSFERYFYLLAILVLARQFFQTVRSALMGIGREERSETLQILRKGLFGAGGLVLVSLGWGVTGALLGHLLASIVVGTVGLSLLARELELKLVWDRTNYEIPARALLSFNAYSVFLSLLLMSLYHVDILLLQPLSGSQATGYYRAALYIAEFVWFAPFALQMVLLHATAELWAQEKVEEISTIASRVTRYTIVLTVLVALGIGALAETFMPLYYGREFAFASSVVLLLLPGAFGFAVARPIIAIGQANGQLPVLVAATGLAATTNLVLNLLLIPLYGMYGAAIATSISYGSMVLLHVWTARRIGFNPLQDLRLGRIGLTAAITTPALYVIPRYFDSAILSLVLVPPVGAGIYALAAVKLGVIDQEELERGIASVPSPFDRHLTRIARYIG